MKKLAVFGIMALFFVLAGCADYGEKVSDGNAEIFYKDGATKEEAQALLDYLKEIKMIDGKKEQTAQLLKDGDIHIVKFVIEDGKHDNEDVKVIFTRLKKLISNNVFDGAEVEVHLCNDKLESKSKL